LISAEDSTKSIFLPLIRADIVEAIFITRIEEPIDVLRELSRGKWLNDAGELVDGGLSDVCAYLLEGFTSFSESIQESNRDNRRFLGEQKDSSYTTQGGEVLALPGRFSYGFVQLEMIRFVRSFAMLPGIERVVWTAHENKGTEDGKPIKGPGSVGQAATDKVQKHVGMLLHLDSVKGERVLHFDRHPDPESPLISYPSRLSVPLKAMKYFHEALGTTGKNVKPVLDPETNSIKHGIFDLLEAEEFALKRLEEDLKK